MIKQKKVFLLIVIVFILTAILTNFFGIMYLPVYHYKTKNNGFEYSEIDWKGITFEDTVSSFETYKKANPNDTILYRTFKKEPLKFWNWYEYQTHPRYKLPYKKQ